MALLEIPTGPRVIGECIYCGETSDSLSKEHAIPYGINGPWTLQRASCQSCAQITHRFERDTLRGLFGTLRNILSLQSRRRGDRPKRLPLVIEKRQEQDTIYLSPRDYPAYLPCPIFPPPGLVTGAPKSNLIYADIRFMHCAGPSFEEIAEKYGADFVGARLNYAPEEFARTLGKIAYAAAVYALGVDALRSSPMRSIILGEERCFGYWIGSWEGDLVNRGKGLHAMEIKAKGTEIHVILRLFSQLHAPEYHIVLGQADPEFANSHLWPWK